MFGRKKKEREKQKDRFKKMFHLQFAEFKKKAIDEKKKLREVYWGHHWAFKSRQATNIITADRVGRGEHTREIEIEEISKRDSNAEELFREALDEFIDEVGEVVIRQVVHEEKTAELCTDDLHAAGIVPKEMVEESASNSSGIPDVTEDHESHEGEKAEGDEGTQ